MEQIYAENLAKLRDFLMTNDLPFEMSDYRTDLDDEDPEESKYLTKDDIDKGTKGCGTAGCAIGWAPFVVPPTETNWCGTGANAHLAYGAYMEDQFGISWHDDQFIWLFDAAWASFDNTREGAAFRIDMALTNPDHGYNAVLMHKSREWVKHDRVEEQADMCKRYLDEKAEWLANWSRK